MQVREDFTSVLCSCSTVGVGGEQIKFAKGTTTVILGPTNIREFFQLNPGEAFVLLGAIQKMIEQYPTGHLQRVRNFGAIGWGVKSTGFNTDTTEKLVELVSNFLRGNQPSSYSITLYTKCKDVVDLRGI